jgi:hypothetical protein
VPGPQGEPGPQGPQGEPGPQGPAGTNVGGVRFVGTQYGDVSTNPSARTPLATLTFTPTTNASAVKLVATTNCFAQTSSSGASYTQLTFTPTSPICPPGTYCPVASAGFPYPSSSAGSATLTQVVVQPFVAGTQYAFTVYGFQSADMRNPSCTLAFSALLTDALAP